MEELLTLLVLNAIAVIAQALARYAMQSLRPALI